MESSWTMQVPNWMFLMNLFFPWRSHHMEKLMEIDLNPKHRRLLIPKQRHRYQERQRPQTSETKLIWAIACAYACEGAANLHAALIMPWCIGNQDPKFSLTCLFQLSRKGWNPCFTCSHTLIKHSEWWRRQFSSRGIELARTLEYPLSCCLLVSSQPKAFKPPKLGL